LTKASTGVDHTSASPDSTNQFGANVYCSARGFIEKQAEGCMTPSPSEERNWSQKGPAPCALVVKEVKAFY